LVESRARGRLVGLSTTTTKADLARAMCEGLAYAARHCLETGGLATRGSVTLCGGGSRAGAFRQLLADVLGRTLLVARQPEAGARGAAIAGLLAAGAAIDLEVWTQPDGIVEPNPQAAGLYDRLYRRYREELAAAREIWSGEGRIYSTG
jgi:sugar (pentulose or hexulose) kinase